MVHDLVHQGEDEEGEGHERRGVLEEEPAPEAEDAGDEDDGEDVLIRDTESEEPSPDEVPRQQRRERDE